MKGYTAAPSADPQSERIISKADDLAAMIAESSRSCAHYVPLLRAVRAGRVALALPERHGAISSTRLKRAGRPVVVVLGDDDYMTTGPDGWVCTERVFGWARHIIIHAAAGHAEHYEAIALAAQVSGRLVLIETSSDAAVAWNNAAVKLGRRAVIQAVIPGPGVQHPAPLDRSAMQ
jgi:hypothetical protein